MVGTAAVELHFEVPCVCSTGACERRPACGQCHQQDLAGCVGDVCRTLSCGIERGHLQCSLSSSGLSQGSWQQVDGDVELYGYSDE